MMRAIWCCLAATLAAVPAPAQQSPPLAVIEQQDAQEITRIFDEQVPPRWSKPVVEWLNRLVVRQAERAKAEADKAKADVPKDEPK